jgi:hypothetical protein
VTERDERNDGTSGTTRNDGNPDCKKERGLTRTLPGLTRTKPEQTGWSSDWVLKSRITLYRKLIE